MPDMSKPSAADGIQKEIPMYATVIDKIGKPIVLNICMLGTLLSITELVSADSIMKVLETRILKDFLDMNRKALELGIQLGAEHK